CDISPFSYTHYYSFHLPRSPRSTLFPYTTLFRSLQTGPAPSLRHRRSPPESRPGGDKRSKPGKWEPHLRPPRPISSMPPAFHSPPIVTRGVDGPQAPSPSCPPFRLWYTSHCRHRNPAIPLLETTRKGGIRDEDDGCQRNYLLHPEQREKNAGQGLYQGRSGGNRLRPGSENLPLGPHRRRLWRLEKAEARPRFPQGPHRGNGGGKRPEQLGHPPSRSEKYP